MRNNILLKFIIKSIVSSVVSILLLAYLSSYIVYRLDIDLLYLNTISIIVCGLSSVIISFISTLGFKNNGVLMGVLSIVPLALYTCFTFAFGENTMMYFGIKLVIILVLSSLIGFLNTKKNKKIRV